MLQEPRRSSAMRRFSILIHLKDQSQPITTTLKSLAVCDEVVVIDHVATDETKKMLRQHGAKVVEAIEGVQDGAYVTNAANDWVLCLQPSEHMDNTLRAALQRWKEEDEKKDEQVSGYMVAIHSQDAVGSKNGSGRELRFVNRKRINWTEELPQFASNVRSLPGALLRAA